MNDATTTDDDDKGLMNDNASNHAIAFKSSEEKRKAPRHDKSEAREGNVRRLRNKMTKYREEKGPSRSTKRHGTRRSQESLER